MQGIYIQMMQVNDVQSARIVEVCPYRETYTGAVPQSLNCVSGNLFLYDENGVCTSNKPGFYSWLVPLETPVDQDILKILAQGIDIAV